MRKCIAFVLAATIAALAAPVPNAQSGTLYWSSATNTVWDTDITQNWGTVSGGPYNAAKWTSGSDAVFQGTAGTVKVDSAGVSAKSLSFGYTSPSGGNYIIGGSGTLTLTGTGPNVTCNGYSHAEINTVIAGSVGLNKQGPYRLYISNSRRPKKPRKNGGCTGVFS